MWFKKYWPTLLGLALQAESLWKAFKWALDWRGRYDALAGTYHEVGGAGVVIGYILDPPPWFYPLAFLAGLILIWWNFRRNREQANTQILAHHYVTAASDRTPRGEKLITLGHLFVSSAFILAVAGLVLLFIGYRQKNERLSNMPSATREPTEVPIAQSTPSPSPPPARPQQPARTFVDADVTPEYLAGLYKGNTALRAETLVAEQIGKWMSVSGPLGEVHPVQVLGGTKAHSLVVFSYSAGKAPIYMWFSGEWMDRLALLSKDQNISVQGQIKKVVSYDSRIELENCELIDTDPVPNAPAQSPDSSTIPRRPRRRAPKRTSRN
jgi:hypothetical protein